MAGRGGRRRAAAAVVMVVILILVDLIVVGLVLSGSRDHDVTVRHMETIESFYAAEAGMNMAIRELMEDIDEDLDGTKGSISNDAVPDPANDPVLGNAFTYVSSEPDTPVVGQTRLNSEGRSGEARRSLQAILK